MTLAQKLDAIDQAGQGGRLQETVLNLSKALVRKSESAFTPSRSKVPANKSDHNNSWVPSRSKVPANTTEWWEKTVAKQGSAETSMGGNPQAKRGVPEDELTGGLDKLDEPDDGAARIKKQKKKGKAQVPSGPAVTTLKSWSMYKGGVPLPPGRPEDEGPADDEDMGDEPEYDDSYDDGEYDDGDEQDDAQGQLSSTTIAIAEMLQQNPDLMQQIQQMLQGSMQAQPEPGQEQGGGPPPQGGGDGGTHIHLHQGEQQQQQPALQRSMGEYQYQEWMQKSIVNDKRVGEFQEAIEASVPLQLLTDHMVKGFSVVLDRMDALGNLVKSQQGEITRLHRMVNGLGEATVEIGKSVVETQALTKSIRSQPVEMPHPGLFTMGRGQEPANPGRNVTVDKGILSSTIIGAANAATSSDMRKSIAGLLPLLDAGPGGPEQVISRMPPALFDLYKANLPA